ncbi:ribosomal RNA-processing protein 14-like isoform X2 [Amaranthus tricolor]|uniref:ribosomal RNA-processing protein 14-like isoform X2 n=1 Tax=Amaranthus tricolor TaxID=29722 RepID=UPI002582FC5D|nr:ribosomal RNA-processing protein 14-like isoform X2 [Amaranthus tricolor]
MKKKKQTSVAKGTTVDDSTAIDGSSSSVVVDVKSIVKDHAKFFDKLVELIPARFYLPTNDDEKPWIHGLSKAEKAEAKLKSIENTKKARRNRLDPVNSSKTTLDLLKESLEKEQSEKEGLIDGDGLELRNSEEKRSVTYEELQQRLRKKIAELRANRGDGSGEGRRREKREWKRKRNDNGEDDDGEDEDKVTKDNERDIEKEASEAAKGIEFGKVKLAGSSDDVLKKKKKRKLSKEKELKRALELEEAKKDPEKGEAVAKKHSWKAATERAMGVKVHDNPKLIKESLRKEKKKHKKSVEQWKQRVETTQKMKKEKQDKRKGNIKAKIDKKKQAKIEKREKKLMRPGFEGRKEGFITGN